MMKPRMANYALVDWNTPRGYYQAVCAEYSPQEYLGGIEYVNLFQDC
jgi:hypothetical protein